MTSVVSLLELDPINKIQHMQALVSPLSSAFEGSRESESVTSSSLALVSFILNLSTLSKGYQADGHINDQWWN